MWKANALQFSHCCCFWCLKIKYHSIVNSIMNKCSGSSYFYRCYCTGSSNSACIISGRTFNCTCDNNRNVLGVACEECPTGLYMDRDAFNCNQNCNCDQNGTKNESLNDCEDVRMDTFSFSDRKIIWKIISP